MITSGRSHSYTQPLTGKRKAQMSCLLAHTFITQNHDQRARAGNIQALNLGKLVHFSGGNRL